MIVESDKYIERNEIIHVRISNHNYSKYDFDNAS